MIAAILGLLGVSGGAGLALHFFGWAGMLKKLTGFGRGAKAVAARIPPKAKLAIAGVLLLLALFFVHQHFVHKALKAADEAGYARGVRVYQRALEIVHARAAARRQVFEHTSSDISKEVRTQNENQARSIFAGADTLSLRGAASARCGPVDRSGVPAGAGGRQSSGGPGAAQVAGLPDDAGVELIAVPFPGAVAFGEASDLNRSEVLAWRDWYDRQFKAWEQFRNPPKH
jgi:hypothetical protein